MVATSHPIASQAGVDAIRRGGNAVDAAVAAALTLGVVDGHNSGLGGGCFLVIRLATGEILAIDGRETAPAAATREMFVRDGKADTELSLTGALASGVPGALAAYQLALERGGQLALKVHLLAAAAIAEKGFAIDAKYASRSKDEAADLARFESSRALFLTPDGEPLPEGFHLVQHELAATYRDIAESGIAWFYEGPFATATGEWMKNNGGVLAAADFASYLPKLRTPIRSTYRGFGIVGFPPPSSGGVHVAQLLNVLETFDLRRWVCGSADGIHAITEAMRLAFADRAYWLGDPDFAPVPRGLLTSEYARELASKIDMAVAATAPEHGTPPNATGDLFEKHTTHLSTADAEGNWVACTATLNTSFGSKVVVPGTGVLLNNQMDDFSIQPGVANAFNLVGGEANAVAPGKRPLSSMSPTIVLKDDVPVLSLGAAGGPTIISQTLLAIINFIDGHMSIDAAVAAPRFHHQWMPDELRIERSVPSDVREELRRREHKLNEVGSLGACQAVGRDGNTFIGVSDPRGLGGASGLWTLEDFLVASVRVHLLVSSDEPALCTTLADTDVQRIFEKVNRVWSPAGIAFRIESILREEPARPLDNPAGSDGALLTRRQPASADPALFHVYYVKDFAVNGIFFPEAIFVKDTASLREIPGGIDEPIPRVTSHELGHALGLPHRQDTTNLMASGTTGTALNSDEISRVRAAATDMPRFSRLNKLLAGDRAGNSEQAVDIHSWLRALPLSVDEGVQVEQLGEGDDPSL